MLEAIYNFILNKIPVCFSKLVSSRQTLSTTLKDDPFEKTMQHELKKLNVFPITIPDEKNTSSDVSDQQDIYIF